MQNIINSKLLDLNSRTLFFFKFNCFIILIIFLTRYDSLIILFYIKNKKVLEVFLYLSIIQYMYIYIIIN